MSRSYEKSFIEHIGGAFGYNLQLYETILQIVFFVDQQENVHIFLSNSMYFNLNVRVIQLKETAIKLRLELLGLNLPFFSGKMSPNFLNLIDDGQTKSAFYA